jgi:hypothetical protein
VTTEVEKVILRSNGLCIKTRNKFRPVCGNCLLCRGEALPSLQVLLCSILGLLCNIREGQVRLVNLAVGVQRKLLQGDLATC